MFQVMRIKEISAWVGAPHIANYKPDLFNTEQFSTVRQILHLFWNFFFLFNTQWVLHHYHHLHPPWIFLRPPIQFLNCKCVSLGERPLYWRKLGCILSSGAHSLNTSTQSSSSFSSSWMLHSIYIFIYLCTIHTYDHSLTHFYRPFFQNKLGHWDATRTKHILDCVAAPD